MMVRAVLVGLFLPAVAWAGDKDGDGNKNKTDKCIDVAEDAGRFEDEDGCPDPDNDGDGVADDADKCPVRAPRIRTGSRTRDGVRTPMTTRTGCSTPTTGVRPRPKTAADGDGCVTVTPEAVVRERVHAGDWDVVVGAAGGGRRRKTRAVPQLPPRAGSGSTTTTR